MTKFDDYKKNKAIQPDSLLKIITSVIRLGLMLIGIVGLTIKVFQPQGWFTQLINYLTSSNFSWLFVLISIGLIYGLNIWMSKGAADETKTRGNLLMHALLLFGAWCSYRYLNTGSL